MDPMKREKIIRNLCMERGCWGDGSEATEESITDAAQNPRDYDIDTEDLDDAADGAIDAIIRLRLAWSLDPFASSAAPTV